MKMLYSLGECCVVAVLFVVWWLPDRIRPNYHQRYYARAGGGYQRN